MIKKIVSAIILGSLAVGFIGCGESSEPTDNVAKQEQPKKEEVKQEEKKEVKNLGVSINAVKEQFEQQDFTFSNGHPLKDGTPRLMGKSAEGRGSAILELQGKDKLVHVTMLLAASKDDINNNTFNIGYAVLLLKGICPNHKELANWFGEGIQQLVKEPNKKIEKVVDNKKITMQLLKELGSIELQIQPN